MRIQDTGFSASQGAKTVEKATFSFIDAIKSIWQRICQAFSKTSYADGLMGRYIQKLQKSYLPPGGVFPMKNVQKWTV
jgi:hypothetical protein